MTGTQSVCLNYPVNIIPGRIVSLKFGIIGSYHHMNLARLQRVSRVQKVSQQGLASQRLEHFRRAGFHPRAFAGSKDADIKWFNHKADSTLFNARLLPAHTNSYVARPIIAFQKRSQKKIAKKNGRGRFLLKYNGLAITIK
jgi:hypothetical protein